jgi:hypothetical protein
MRSWFVLVIVAVVGCGSAKDSTLTPDGPTRAPDAETPDAAFPKTLDGNRDRLLATYFARLLADPNTQQSNGLLGRELTNVCDLWSKLDPSSRAVFVTITHRLDGSVIATDGSRMLDHVTKLYRIIGGMGATATSAGSCGGGEYNRLIMAMDTALHTGQLAANTRKGASPYDIADISSGGYWRDSHDAAGPHTPFDLSDETNDGAPRGQTQYFKDPASTVANAALGRMDVMTLVDPLALEMDQDYDCAHNSNPSCDYTFYGPACAPKTTQSGAAIYTMDYGDFGPTWKPTGC